MGQFLQNLQNHEVYELPFWVTLGVVLVGGGDLLLNYQVFQKQNLDNNTLILVAVWTMFLVFASFLGVLWMVFKRRSQVR